MRIGLPEADVMQAMDEARDAGIKIEVHQGLPIWEFMPSPMHVMQTHRIAASLRRGQGGDENCGCYGLQDMAIMFPDGSLRRPDVSVYCELPPATQEAARKLPEAVIEVVSPGSEVKDLELSPSFYLLHGIKDVVVFDPRTGSIAHFRRDGRTHLASPAEIVLDCGCVVTV
jgi:Uma2 family endonuclease